MFEDHLATQRHVQKCGPHSKPHQLPLLLPQSAQLLSPPIVVDPLPRTPHSAGKSKPHQLRTVLLDVIQKPLLFFRLRQIVSILDVSRFQNAGASYGGSGAEEQGQAESADKEVRGNGERHGERLHHGDGQAVDHGRDLRAGGEVEDPTQSCRGRGADSEERRSERTRRQLKKDRYWEMIREERIKRRKQQAEARGEEFQVEPEDGFREIPSSPSVSTTEDEELEESLRPRVRLVYGDDYEAVYNLPRRRIRKNTKKKIRSWAGKALSALMVTVAAYTHPVVAAASTAASACARPLAAAASYAQPLVEAAEVYVGEKIGSSGRYGNGADFCEVFAGSANLTQEMAAAGFR